MPSELPPQVTSGKYLVIRDVYGDEKVIEIPSGRRVLVFDGSDVRFVSGAENDPFILNLLDIVKGGDLPSIVGVTAAGQLVQFRKPDEASGKHRLVNVAGAIKWEEEPASGLPSEGVGLFYRDVDGNLVIIGDASSKGIFYLDGTGHIQLIANGAPNTFLQINPAGTPVFSGLPGGNVLAGGASTFSLTGIAAKNTTSAIVNVTAPSLVLTDGVGGTLTVNAVNVSVDTSAAIGEGGLDTGVLANSTWYHVYVISDGVTTNAIFSTDANSPDLSGTTGPYTHWQYATPFFVDGAGNIRNFQQIDRDVTYRAGGAVLGDGMSITTAWTAMVGAVTLSTLLPPNVKTASLAVGGGATETAARAYMVAADANELGQKIMGGVSKDFGAFGNFRQDYDTIENLPILSPGAPSIYWKGKVAVTGKRRVEVRGFRI